MVLDCKKIAEEILGEVKDRVDFFVAEKRRTPTLVIICVGNDPAQAAYVRGKQNDCNKVGVQCITYQIQVREDLRLGDDYIEAKKNELVALIDSFTWDEDVNGVIVQLPLPKCFTQQDVNEILECIPVDKDVDCIHPYNAGKFYQGDLSLVPCTPAAVYKIIEHYQADGRQSLTGTKATIIGRSNLVGRPLAHLLEQHDATVTLCHSKTLNLKSVCRNADIIVSAVGKPGLIKKEMVPSYAKIIDVGITRGDDGKLYGDVCDDVQEVAAVTPVPGGVGLVTRAMLLSNLMYCCEMQEEAKSERDGMATSSTNGGNTYS